MNRPFVEVGIPAHNEAANIAKLLRSIFDQEQDMYRLAKVIVVSDGSVDRTVDTARQINNPKLEVIAHTDNQGKPARINELFRRAESDILVLIDADVVLD